MSNSDLLFIDPNISHRTKQSIMMTGYKTHRNLMNKTYSAKIVFQFFEQPYSGLVHQKTIIS